MSNIKIKFDYPDRIIIRGSLIAAYKQSAIPGESFATWLFAQTQVRISTTDELGVYGDEYYVFTSDLHLSTFILQWG
jgi:hypothetical protein